MAFRRINFFKGLFTRAEDWQAAEAYHIEKRKLHNTTLHEPGIVKGLEVKATADGRGLRVTQGCAIDPSGRDICLDNDAELSISFDDYARLPLPPTLNVTVGLAEKPVDYRQDASNPEYSGHAFLEETAALSIVPDADVDRNAVILAKIRLTKGATKVLDANKPTDPQENELDLRGRKRATAVGAAGSLMQMAELVVSGTIEVSATRNARDLESEYIGRSWVAEAEGHAFHFASVLPTRDGEVSWRLGSSRKGNKVQYTLFIRNHSGQDTEVSYRVYRLR